MTRYFKFITKMQMFSKLVLQICLHLYGTRRKVALVSRPDGRLYRGISFHTAYLIHFHIGGRKGFRLAKSFNFSIDSNQMTHSVHSKKADDYNVYLPILFGSPVWSSFLRIGKKQGHIHSLNFVAIPYIWYATWRFLRVFSANSF